MQKNVFIQLGLNLSVEYSYLAKESFKEEAAAWNNDKFYCPDVLLSVDIPYTVIAVDMNPDKNAILREKFSDIPNLHIWDYVIWHENIENFRHGDYVAVTHWHEAKCTNWAFTGEAITFQTLLEKIRVLPGHEDAVVRGLHANIEGSESNLLQGIDWETSRPWVIRLSPRHGSVSPERNQENDILVKEILTKRGYSFVPDDRDEDEYLTFYPTIEF